MERREIVITGINRNNQNGDNAPGDCHEIVNLRRNEGKWEGVISKRLYGGLNLKYSAIYVHQVDTLEVIVGYSLGGKLYIIDKDAGTETLFDDTINTAEVRFNALGLVLIVYDVTHKRNYYFLLDMETATYRMVGEPFPAPININVGAYETEAPTNQIKGTINPTGSLNYELVDFENDIANLLNKTYFEWKEDGKFHGFMVLRTAFELYDGSYVMYSKPILVYISDGESHEDEEDVEWISSAVASGVDVVEFNVGAKSVGYLIPAGLSEQIESIKTSYENIVKAFVIFASTPFDRYTKVKAQYNHTGGIQIYDDGDVTPEKMLNESLLYKVKSIALENLDVTAEMERLDINWNEVHTGEVMPPEELSAHKLYADFSMVYNRRLWLCGITTKLMEPETPGSMGETYIDDDPEPIWVDIVFEYLLKTSKGNVAVRSETFTTKLTHINLPFVIYYPDSRAYEFRVLVRMIGTDPLTPDEDDNLYVCFRNVLNPHPTHNYAFGVVGDAPDTDDPDTLPTTSIFQTLTRTRITDLIRLTRDFSVQFPWYIPKDVTLSEVYDAADVTVTSELYDENRVQVSEIVNPFVFLARQSYQVGSGRMLGLGVNVTPMSDLSFGMHPVIAFTSKGIWALEIGTGDVLVTRISPVSDEVCNNASSITGIGSYVFFSTDKGLHVISGREVRLASSSLKGSYLSPIFSSDSTSVYRRLVSNVFDWSSGWMAKGMSRTTFELYLAGANIGADYKHDELIVSNPLYTYSYVFNVKERVWYKRAESFVMFSSAWPKTYALMEDNLHYLCSIDEEEGSVLPVLIETAVMSMGNLYAKIDRLALKGSMTLDSTGILSVAVYGSGAKGSNFYPVNVKSINPSGVFDGIVLTRTLRSARYIKLLITGNFDSVELHKIIMDIEAKWGKL